MNQFFTWLSANPFATNIVIAAFGILAVAVTLIYVIAFFQGRDVSFWPPKIGHKPDKTNLKKTDASDIQEKQPVKSKIPFDLTGIWKCDDNATYYIQQVNDKIFWLGETQPEKPQFCNVAFGVISENEVHLQWADTPKGKYHYTGSLILQVFNNGTRIKVIQQKEGRFTGLIWERNSDI